MTITSFFITRAWRPHLKAAIQDTIDRYRGDAPGEEIDVILLSGGSANLQWLASLFEDELSSTLADPSILRLKDYRDVVAKATSGLDDANA